MRGLRNGAGRDAHVHSRDRGGSAPPVLVWTARGPRRLGAYRGHQSAVAVDRGEPVVRLRHRDRRSGDGASGRTGRAGPHHFHGAAHVSRPGVAGTWWLPKEKFRQMLIRCRWWFASRTGPRWVRRGTTRTSTLRCRV